MDSDSGFAAIDADVFDRQKRVKGWDQKAVSSANVLVVGAGALGNEVVKNLVQIGVGKISVVDYDTIVPANLNRCVFFSKKNAERKEYKAGVLSERAALLSESTEITPVFKKIEALPAGFYRQFDFAFGCLDNLGARLHLNANCYGAVPLIDGGTSGFMGKVQAVFAPSPCVECGMSKRDYDILWKKYSCTGDALDFLDPKMPALPTTTSAVAAIQVNEFLKMRLNADELNEGDGAAAESGLVGRYLFFNGLKSSSQVFEVAKRADCPVHQ
ncbi:MAG: ThiF family adenylyltransferase [Candidatus Micrarchaeia archaeon]|jgi:molybdopterin/thiamine biosynthesis adenylyltransferase